MKSAIREEHDVWWSTCGPSEQHSSGQRIVPGSVKGQAAAGLLHVAGCFACSHPVLLTCQNLMHWRLRAVVIKVYPPDTYAGMVCHPLPDVKVFVCIYATEYFDPRPKQTCHIQLWCSVTNPVHQAWAPGRGPASQVCPEAYQACQCVLKATAICSPFTARQRATYIVSLPHTSAVLRPLARPV